MKPKKKISRETRLKRLDSRPMTEDQMKKLSRRDLVDLIHMRLNRKEV